MTESLRLFDQASRRMLAGIKAEFPGISEDEARRIRDERLDVIRRIEALPMSDAPALVQSNEDF
jgi:hypothetical protein